jgi:hypothetical protein
VLWRRAAEAGGSTEDARMGGSSRVKGLRFGTTVPTGLEGTETEPNQTNINYLNQIKPLKASNHLLPIQIDPI